MMDQEGQEEQGLSSQVAGKSYGSTDAGSVNPGNGKSVVQEQHVEVQGPNGVSDQNEEALGNDETPLMDSGPVGLSARSSNAPHNLTSNAESMMNLMKGNIGTGILAMASAFNNAGLWTGLVGLFVIGIIAIHCMHLLVNASHKLCKEHDHTHLDYGDVAEVSFDQSPFRRLHGHGKYARWAVNVFLCITQFGFCIVYVLFVAENVKQVVEAHIDVELAKQIYMVGMLVLLFPYAFVRKMKHLSWFSSLANALTAVGLIIILQYCFRNLRPYFYVKAFSSAAQLPLFFGTVIYAFEGIGVVLPIENKMKNPEDFGGKTGVLNTGMVLVAVMYVAVGFYGYLTFGEDSAASITLNLPSEFWLYEVVKIVLSLAIFCTYGLQFYVPCQIIIPPLKQYFSNTSSQLVEYSLRIIFVVFTFLLAAVIPHLDLMISLVGALASSTLAIIFPPILDTIVFWDELGRFPKLRLAKNLLLLIIGIIGFVTGTGISVMQIIQTF